MFSAQVALPPKRVETLVENCRRFLQYPTISREHILSVIRWDSAVLVDLDEVHQETALGVKLTKDKCQNVLNLLQLSLLRTDRLTHSNLVQRTLYQ